MQGLTPMLAMMTSCAAGVTVVNIDNGFGAGYYVCVHSTARLGGKTWRSIVLDCYSGIAGDMTLGALIDLGADLQRITAELKKLPSTPSRSQSSMS